MKKLVVLIAALALLAGGANGSFVVDALTPAVAANIQPANEDGGSRSCYSDSYWSTTYHSYEPNYLGSGIGVTWHTRVTCDYGWLHIEQWYTV